MASRRVSPRLLITGGAGYIGAHTAHAAVDAGYAVTVVDDLSAGTAASVPAAAALRVGDIGDRGFINAVLAEVAPACVLNFAAGVSVPQSVADPVRYYRDNTVASLTLIEACVRAATPQIIFSSTAAVYGMATGGYPDESAQTQPISPSGWSKLMTERMLADIAAAGGPRYAILRYFNVAGADPRGRVGQSGAEATHLIKVACQVALGQRPYLQIYGLDYDTPDGSCIRDYIHVSDLATAHLAVLPALARADGPLILNCGHGRGASVLEVVAAVARVAGRPLPTRAAPRRPGDLPVLVARAERIRDLGVWRPQVPDLESMARSALAWETRLTEGAAPAP